jgi:hypothetical protein
MEVVDLILRWVVAPIAAIVVMIYRQQQRHHTDLEVLKNQAEIVRSNHDREIKEIKDMLNKILEKLDEKADK